MKNNFFVRYELNENLINITENKEFKKSKDFFRIWFFYWKKHKIKSTLIILLIFIVSIVSVFNILIARQITAILVTETMMNTFRNPKLMVDLINAILHENDFNLTEEQKNKLLEFLSNPEYQISLNVINEVIKIHFFKYVRIGNDSIVRADFLIFNLSKINLVWLLFGSIILIIITMYISYLMCGEISEEANTDLKNKLVKSLLNKNLEFYNLNSQGKITETIVKDSKNIANQLKVAPIILIFIIFSTIGSIGMLIYIDLIISLLMFSIILLVLLIALIVVLAISKPIKKSMEERTRHDSEITEKISCIRLIKSSGKWDHEVKNNNINTYNNNKKNKKLNYVISIIPGIIIGVMGCLTLSSMIIGVFIYGNNTQKLITVFSSFVAGVFIMVTPIFQLNTILQSINETNKSSQNIADVISDNNNVIEKSITYKIENNEIFKIEFKDVHFAYPSSPVNYVIDKLNLVLEKGKSYAFVGPSGSGKSTITKLLMRFYEGFEGKIIINNKYEIRDINLKNWMLNIGYVDQEPQILSATIKENIKYVKEDATDEEVVDACRKAKIHDLICAFPNGYDTFLNEKGKQLSGGQKQRIVIARMFLKNPSLIILDEATSALDNLVEKEISEELNKLIIGKTTIAIAHRLSTIKNYDKIFVLDENKKIVQTGTFNDLINQKGLFRELYDVTKEEN